VLPDPPANAAVLAATAAGGEVVLALHRPGFDGLTIAALAPGGSWRVIAQLPGGIDYSSAAIAGGRAWIVPCNQYEPSVTEVAITTVDLSSGEVTDRSAIPGRCPRVEAAGNGLVVLSEVPDSYRPQSVLAYLAVGEGWRELNPAPGVEVGDGTWTGSELLFWGRCSCGGFGGRAFEGGHRLRL